MLIVCQNYNKTTQSVLYDRIFLQATKVKKGIICNFYQKVQIF